MILNDAVCLQGAGSGFDGNCITLQTSPGRITLHLLRFPVCKHECLPICLALLWLHSGTSVVFSTQKLFSYLLTARNTEPSSSPHARIPEFLLYPKSPLTVSCQPAHTQWLPPPGDRQPASCLILLGLLPWAHPLFLSEETVSTHFY